MRMSESESRAVEFLGKYGLCVQKQPNREFKTPDFHVDSTAGTYFLAEVKAIQGPGEDRPVIFDTLFNTISSDIHTAAKQIKSVNSKHLVPNVLLLISGDLRINRLSLLDFFRGVIVIEDQVLRRVSQVNGRVRPDLHVFDLFVIVETCGEGAFFYTKEVPEFFASLTRLFQPLAS